jgi:ankyrin repeat protein
VVSALLNAGAELKVVKQKYGDVNENNALHWAAINGHADVIRAFAEANVDLSITGDDRETALQKAAEKAHLGTVRALLSAGVDPNVVSSDETALSIAANTNFNSDGNYTAVAHALLEAGADPDLKSPLGGATYRGNPKMVRILLEAGASTEYPSGEPIVESARYGKRDEVEQLLREASAQK